MTWTRGCVGVLELPDGRLVRGRSLRQVNLLRDMDGRGDLGLPGRLQPPRSRGRSPCVDEPQWSLHLVGRHGSVATCGPGPVREVLWPDFRIPTYREEALDALGEAWSRAVDERVEVACRGGTGRTGTALAALTLLAAHRMGSPLTGDEAIHLVRSAYRRRAVETPGQRRWLRELPWAARP